MIQSADIFGSHRPYSSQMHICYQDHLCYPSMTENLCASNTSTLHTDSSMPSSGCLQSNSFCTSKLDSGIHGSSYIGSEFHSPSLPSDSRTTKQKSFLHYTSPSDCLNVEPLGMSYTTTAVVPPLNPPMFGKDDPYQPMSAHQCKFQFPSMASSSSVITHTSTSSYTPSFPPVAGGLGYAMDPIVAGYDAASGLHPLNTDCVNMTKSKPLPEASRLQRKPGHTRVKRQMHPSNSSSLIAPSAYQTQFLMTVKPEPMVEPSPSGGGGPIPQSSKHKPISDFSSRVPPSNTQHALLSPLPPRCNSSPGIPASLSRRSSSTSQASSVLVPKTERLSPTSTCGDSRQSTESVSTANSLGFQSSFLISGQGRLESNRMESRRITHISAEQKRRFNIKLGFDTLHNLVTTLHSQPSLKVSKATTLQKTADYICKLQQERTYVQEEVQRLREEIEKLNVTINRCQQQLPDTGVPITHQRFDQMREMFDDYVQSRTLQNWKFWVFSIIIRPLFESFNGMVSTASIDDLSRTSLSWLDQHCSLPALRPTVLSSLRQLSTSTSILSDPSLVPEQAAKAVTARRSHSNSCS